MFCRSSRTSKGSYTVDASLTLPVFVLCFSILLSLVFEAAEEDALYRKLSEEANAGSSVIGAVGVDVPFMIASGVTRTREIEKEVFYRPFCGESEAVKQRDVTVYVFPKSGVRYHVAGCSTMDRNPDYVAISKSEAVAGGYTECRLCGVGGTDYFKKRKTEYGVSGEE